ncbi:zinc ABC transporter substrate-binding protein [Ferrimonas sediminicola]|uniref:Zinc ABC transporter substrate-binding protein n=2 Tax=Ferrimonas sediminicola TaxID=2569538 RepID=A0A4U1BNF3_9GAMM|nr:zinc ABC transporter substrate-binding protein [Ferrimonas sediminicola]TKB51628.1 zinc ABC transporter substrate-binding protein [Ferrimonas sediminicola]
MMPVLAALLAAPQAWAMTIFTCEPEYAALARELAPEANVSSATTALQDPHHVQARPSLIAKLRRADLAICAGADLEVGWLPMLQMKANNRKVRDGQPGMLYAAQHLEALGRLERVDRSMGDVHAGGNPHFHFSPSRIQTMAEVIAAKLVELDPDNEPQYRANLTEFSQRWSQATTRWRTQAAPLKGKRVIAYHTSFQYLFDWLGMEQAGDLEPKPGLPPTTGHLAQLLKLTETTPIMAVIYTGYQDGRGAQWLGQRAGLPVVQLPFGPGVEGAADLFQLYDTNIALLLAAMEESDV